MNGVRAVRLTRVEGTVITTLLVNNCTILVLTVFGHHLHCIAHNEVETIIC